MESLGHCQEEQGSRRCGRDDHRRDRGRRRGGIPPGDQRNA